LIYSIFATTEPEPKQLHMTKPEPTDRAALARRESEIQGLIRQMKLDQLENSPVYQKLEQELLALKNKLIQIL
jgi:hypothetical protein